MDNKERVYLEKEGYPSFLYGGFGRRFLAFIVDLILISAIYKLITIPLVQILDIEAGLALSRFEGLSYSLIYLLYFTLTTKLTNGQTIGKILFDLRVVCPGEENLSWSTVITRELLSRYILKRIIILYISVLFTDNHRHIGDFFSNTYVVREDYIYEYSRIVENPAS